MPDSLEPPKKQVEGSEAAARARAANRRATVALIVALLALLITALSSSKPYWASPYNLSHFRFHKTIHRQGTQAI